MINKDKITISIDKALLSKVDERIDKVNFKNRSITSVIGFIALQSNCKNEKGKILYVHAFLDKNHFGLLAFRFLRNVLLVHFQPIFLAFLRC